MEVNPKRLSIALVALVIVALGVASFSPAFAQTQAQQCESPYTVLQGDTLQGIAERCGLTVEELVEANPELGLLVDQQLVIPQGQATTGQTDQQGQIPQTGTRTLQAGDTLGSILTGLELTEQQIQSFLLENADLNLTAGQTVTFPAGVTLVDGQGVGADQGQAGQATATPAAGTDAAQATATPATGGTDAGAQATATPAAGDVQGFVCAVGDSQAGETYLTEAGDTLGTLLSRMGLDVATMSAGQVTTDQVMQFVYLNCDLAFEEGQTVNLDQGQIPQTGPDQGQTTDQGQVGQPDFSQAGPGDLNLDLTEDDIPAGFSLYIVQGGDSLSSIARQYNVSIERLLELNPSIENPNIIYRGQHIVVPSNSG